MSARCPFFAEALMLDIFESMAHIAVLFMIVVLFVFWICYEDE